MELEQVTFKKGSILQRKGDIAQRIYWVQQGLLRSYTIDEKGKEHVFMFASEGWIMGDNVPLGHPAELYMDALEDTQALVGDKASIPHLNADQSEKLFRRMYVLQQRVLMLMSASAADRYLHFTQTYPDIIQRVPQRLIASYLGITPEALSKVKRDLKEQGSSIS